MSNATTFINKYNKIDEYVRSVYNFKASQSFTDCIRRASEKNIIIRKYESELIDYARLRNAIVHKSIDGKIIAEPNDEVTQKIAMIAKLLTSPPKIANVFRDKKITGIECDISLKELILLTGRSGHSNIPVYRKGKMIGVINPKRIVKAISKTIHEKQDLCEFFNNTYCDAIIDSEDLSEYYAILSKKDSIDKVAQCYELNKKLRAVLVTENGILGETVLNILTPADLASVNKILENY